MTKTEYRSIVINYQNELENYLNMYSADGWQFRDVVTIFENNVPISVLILVRVVKE